MYGFQDSNDLAPGQSGGKFGLNSGVFVTKFEYNPNAGTNGAEQDAIDLTVQIGEREYTRRFFPVSKIYSKDNGELTDTTTEEYKELFAKEVALLNGTLTDVVRCFVPEEDIKTALAAPIANFKDFAEVLQRLVHGVPNWNKTPVDVFLCYQWNVSGDNNRTYLELPKNVKHGSFIARHQGAGYTPVEASSGIKYANEEGLTHPLKRNEWFAGSAFSKQTVLEDTTQEMGSGTGAATW